jgi:hypothetical protein
MRRIGGGAHDADLVAITGRFETGTATPIEGQGAFYPIPERGAASRPRRGSLVAAEPEHPLEAERADAVLLAGHEPHRHEPDSERLARAIEKSAGGERGAAVTAPAPQQLSDTVQGSSLTPQSGQTKPSGPAQTPTVGPTSIVVPESLVQFLKWRG